MIRMFVRHLVTDFDRWKQGYEAFGARRNEMGVRAQAVFQSVEDPNEVTVWHDFDNLETAKVFVESPQLREAMSAAGVSGQPKIWFTHQV